MSSISKRDVQQLAADIKSALIAGHAVARRVGGNEACMYGGFVGGLEVVIGHFIAARAGEQARAAIVAAFNYQPTEADIAERFARHAAARRSAGAA